MLVISLMISGVSQAQSISDQVEVLKLCINLPEIQTILDNQPDKADNFVIMQHPTVLPENDFYDEKGRPVVFVSKDEATSGEYISYLYFQTFNITDSSCELLMFYDYNRNIKHKEKRLSIALQIVKEGKSWKIIQ